MCLEGISEKKVLKRMICMKNSLQPLKGHIVAHTVYIFFVFFGGERGGANFANVNNLQLNHTFLL